MNKKFFLSWLVIFVLAMGTDFVIHGLLLHGDYVGLPALYRSEADGAKYFGWMLLAHVMMTGAFVWVYDQGRTSQPWLMQGLRFGLAMALLFAIPTFLIYYAVQPVPELLVVKQCGLDFVRLLLLGVVVAALNK
ncbi:MAG: hypothetical protein IPL96_06015 [Holophagaceae bacterium]|nr:hypothetical protein [Holophagaceae bacterium]